MRDLGGITYTDSPKDNILFILLYWEMCIMQIMIPLSIKKMASGQK
jgi:hypothetical protein